MRTNPWRRFLTKYIGDKAFYKMVLAIAVPIVIQNGITNFVGMLDNIMVGQIGTEEMSGVSIVNQLHFVYMLCVFGGVGGIGIFTAQYCGAGDHEGIRKTFRVKLWIGLFLTIAAFLVLNVFGTSLIRLYLNDESGLNAEAIEATLRFGKQYLYILMFSFPAVFLLQAYSSTLRECGETVLPMKAGIAAVLVNLLGNYLLIFGSLGLPKMGVQGAAAATVASRYVEALIVMVWTHTHTEKQPWARGVLKKILVPLEDVFKYLKKGLPLLLNEALWSTAYATLSQCYSMRGLSVVAGLNIATTLNNLLRITFITLGTATGIVIGQLLGAGRLEEAKDKDNKLLFFSVAVSVVTALMIVAGSFFFPKFYNTSDEVRAIASSFLLLDALSCPMDSFMNGAYFTLRAGGKTLRTFLFDSVSLWVVSVPVAFVLSRFTDLPAPWIYLFVIVANCFKVLLGYIWVRKNIWLVDLVGKENN
ncbi:MAG: MATE family efflux transporter [Lachnospiraceae bacterium]|nr:MATE family efflux transporter [Lachnospiraceae bacterium]